MFPYCCICGDGTAYAPCGVLKADPALVGSGEAAVDGMDDTGRSLYGSAWAMPGEGPMPASDIGGAGGTAAAAKAGVEVAGWLFRLPPRRSSRTAIRPMMAMTTAPPTAIPAIAPTPSFDPLLLEEDEVPVEDEPWATVMMLGMVVDWPGLTVMTVVLATPPELCTTVDTIVAELPAVKVTMAVDVCGVTTTVPPGVVVPTTTGVGVVTAGAGLAQESHCARLMFRGSPVPPQLVFN
jgi:hypothetical protein